MPTGAQTKWWASRGSAAGAPRECFPRGAVSLAMETETQEETSRWESRWSRAPLVLPGRPPQISKAGPWLSWTEGSPLPVLQGRSAREWPIQPTLALHQWLRVPHCLLLREASEGMFYITPSVPQWDSPLLTCPQPQLSWCDNCVITPSFLAAFPSHLTSSLLCWCSIHLPDRQLVFCQLSWTRLLWEGEGRGDFTFPEWGWFQVDRIEAGSERTGLGTWRLGPLFIFYCVANTTH